MLRVRLYERSALGEQYRGEILAAPSAINSIYEALRPYANPWLCQNPRNEYLFLIFDGVERHERHERRKTRQTT